MEDTLPTSDSTTSETQPQQLISNLREELKCPLCLELFSDPRLLLCSHTFCSNCLDQLRKRAKYNIISCPLCRHVTPFENIQISSLKRNVNIANIIDLLNSSDQKFKVNSLNSEREFNYNKEQLEDLINFADFNFDETRVPNIFRDWIQSLWFAPANLRTQATFTGEIRKVWCPFWLFDLTLTTYYSAKVCRKIENKTEWKQEEGKLINRYENQLICAISRPKIRKIIETFQDWQLHKIHFQNCNSQTHGDHAEKPADQQPNIAPQQDELQHLSPSNLIPSAENQHPVQDTLRFFKSIINLSSSGLSEINPLSSLSVFSSSSPPTPSTVTNVPESSFIMDPAIDWETCWGQWKKFKDLQFDQQMICRNNLSQPTDCVTDVIDFKHEVKYSNSYRLVYLPIYLSAYTFQDVSYVLAVNGQTGQVSADRPYGLGQLSELCSFGFDLANYLLDSLFLSES